MYYLPLRQDLVWQWESHAWCVWTYFESNMHNTRSMVHVHVWKDVVFNIPPFWMIVLTDVILWPQWIACFSWYIYTGKIDHKPSSLNITPVREKQQHWDFIDIKNHFCDNNAIIILELVSGRNWTNMKCMLETWPTGLILDCLSRL